MPTQVQTGGHRVCDREVTGGDDVAIDAGTVPTDLPARSLGSAGRHRDMHGDSVPEPAGNR
ncbi:MAG: hypothetical protein U0R23_11400 [Candidatus Nanopelagicales bacterium]